MAATVAATPEARKAAERDATLSSCCGLLGEVTLTDSAIIILFAGLLGASDMLAMISTSLLPLLNGLCIIPMAGIAARIGSRRLILWACSMATAAYGLAICAPCFGGWAPQVLLGAILLFALFLAGFIAGWFPLLDSFLAPERRTAFLGRMRFCHQLTAVLFLGAVSLAISATPTIGELQLVLAIGAAVFAGRILFIARIPVFAASTGPRPGTLDGLRAAVANRPLAGFSVYLFVLNLAAFGTIPLAMLHLKGPLGAPANVVVCISAMALFGMLLGYFCAHRIIRRLGTRGALLLFHILLALVNLALFLIGSGGTLTYALVGGLLLLYGFTMAAASIVSSAEMMALARPGNRVMSMALCGAFLYGGSGLSRLLSSLILGSGMLAAGWRLGGLEVCRFQTLFLAYTVLIVFAAAFLVLVPAVFPDDGPPQDGTPVRC